MKKNIIILSTLLLIILTACGSVSNLSNLTGNWVANYDAGTVDVQYILDMKDSSGSLSGELLTKASYAGVSRTVPIADFTGSRSGDSVTLRIGSSSATGTLSGKKLTFSQLSSAGVYNTITFTRR